MVHENQSHVSTLPSSVRTFLSRVSGRGSRRRPDIRHAGNVVGNVRKKPFATSNSAFSDFCEFRDSNVSDRKNAFFQRGDNRFPLFLWINGFRPQILRLLRISRFAFSHVRETHFCDHHSDHSDGMRPCGWTLNASFSTGLCEFELGIVPENMFLGLLNTKHEASFISPRNLWCLQKQ